MALRPLRRLIDGIRASACGSSVVVGCVDRISSNAVVEALCTQGAICIAVRREGLERTEIQRAVRTLLDRSRGVPLEWIGIAAPSLEQRTLGPVCGAPPLLHAKVLVTCEASLSGSRPVLVPRAAWYGSAPWTDAADRHDEVGCWVEDPDVLGPLLDSTLALLQRSGPLRATGLS
jgi:hypothetical protein